MIKRRIKLIMLIPLMAISSCGISKNSIEINIAEEWINAVEQLPDRKNNSGCRATSTSCGRERFKFDVNAYFSVFDHLSVEPGHTLDYIYMSDGIGGKPVLYAYQESDGPLNSYPEFVRATGAEYQATFQVIEHSDDYLAHIQIDDTHEGYFQYAALSIMDDQFYLNWHANYNDTTIITSEEEAFEAFSAANFLEDREEGEWTKEELTFLTWTKWIESRIPGLNYTPAVVMKDEYAIVRFIVFSQWGGFQEVTTTIKRTFPHEILEWKQKNRIFYYSGVMY